MKCEYCHEEIIQDLEIYQKSVITLGWHYFHRDCFPKSINSQIKEAEPKTTKGGKCA